MTGIFACFGVKKSKAPASKALGNQAQRISQEVARAEDHEYALRLQGFGDEDPEMKAAKEERIKRTSQDMEARISMRKSQEADYIRRLQES